MTNVNQLKYIRGQLELLCQYADYELRDLNNIEDTLLRSLNDALTECTAALKDRDRVVKRIEVRQVKTYYVDVLCPRGLEDHEVWQEAVDYVDCNCLDPYDTEYDTDTIEEIENTEVYDTELED